MPPMRASAGAMTALKGATALLDIEPRLCRVRGYKHLPALRRALQADRTERETEKMGKARHKKAA